MDQVRGRAGGSKPFADFLRVCLVSEEYPPETATGGIGTYTKLLAEGLSRGGHDVVVLTRAGVVPSTTTSGGVTVHRLLPAPFSLVPRPVRTRLTRTVGIAAWSVAVRRALTALMKQCPIDVVESPEYFAQSVALAPMLRRRLVPAVVKLHTPTYLCDQLNGIGSGSRRLDDWFGERAERRATLAATLVTSPSSSLIEEVSERWGLDQSRTRVVPNPLDGDLFREVATVPRADDLVLYVGRLERRKGVDVLADAMSQVWRVRPGVRVRLVGWDQPSGVAGVTMAQKLRTAMGGVGVAPGQLTIDAPVEREALPRVYAGAAVAVVPSLYENFPYTCLEAMASGCAVIGSRVGGIPEIIEDGVDGLLVEPGSSEEVARAIVRLADEPGLRARLAEKARDTVRERYSVEAVTAATLDVYREAIERQHKAN